MSITRSIENTADLYGKLMRTFERRPTYGQFQLDWVFDMAMAAWHLVDWYAIEKRENLLSAQNRLKVACPELAICEQICNGAKHLVLNNPNLKPFNIATDVYRTDDLSGISENVLPGDSNVEIILTSSVRITDSNGAAWDAIIVYKRVVEFWRRELKL